MPFVLAGLLIMLLIGCSKIKDNRVPMMQVNIVLNTSSMWELYGVHGYGDYKKFIRHSHIPANFPYNTNTYTRKLKLSLKRKQQLYLNTIK